jgi:hypothetical protein
MTPLIEIVYNRQLYGESRLEFAQGWADCRKNGKQIGKGFKKI